VRPARMNDRALFRYKPEYRVPEMHTVLDWSPYGGAGGGFQGAVEMCNNNGECRKLTGGVMCPSYRVTLNERDVTRGRANSLRLAISGQLGPDALASEDMLETMRLCVACKGCRRECPTGVDMAKMRIEVLAAANRRRGLALRDRLTAYLPRYAPHAARIAPVMNALCSAPGAARLLERLVGLSAKRSLPRWRRDFFSADARAPDSLSHGGGDRSGAASPDLEVAVFADTFNTYFEPENLADAVAVLAGLGYRVTLLRPRPTGRPLCCGRTFLAAGLVEEARTEARRVLAAARPIIARGVALVGLEPSCLLTLRDEFLSLLPGDEAEALSRRSLLLEEFIAQEAAAGRIARSIGKRKAKVVLHGHCHQKAFGAMAAVTETLALIDGLEVETVESSCCGMAGGFGYGAETYSTSIAMGELSLLPAVRKADRQSLVAADGFSCRHQIRDGTGRTPLHVARLLRDALEHGERGARGTASGC
jgi:Fe-S oxidoreductase